MSVIKSKGKLRWKGDQEKLPKKHQAYAYEEKFSIFEATRRENEEVSLSDNFDSCFQLFGES